MHTESKFKLPNVEKVSSKSTKTRTRTGWLKFVTSYFREKQSVVLNFDDLQNPQETSL